MRAKLANAWEIVTSSLWFVPALLVAASFALAALCLAIDEGLPALGGGRRWLFGGTAGAARTLLSSLAGSLITVVALTFSVTIVAIQQAATQYSPRVMRNFMRDRGNQTVLGSYIATFVYALLVLRQVREPSEGDAAFVPALSISVALLLALLCVGLLIYFVHHIATSLQAATITDAIRRELREVLDARYPVAFSERPSEGHGTPPDPPGGPPPFAVRAAEAGFLRAVDEEQLLATLGPAVALARVRPQVGDYVLTGAPLIDLWPAGPLDPACRERLVEQVRAAFTVGRERSTRQDLLFGVRQLVDIALRALSPGINDPTTAEHCLAHLGDVVAQLAGRAFPVPWRQSPETGTTLMLNQPDFARVVDAAFSQIRREATGDVHVTGYLLGVLAQVAAQVPSAARALPIRDQVDEVLALLDRQDLSVADDRKLRERAATVYASLDGALAVPSGYTGDLAPSGRGG